MSSALVRQALAFVEGEDSGQGKRRGKKTQRQPAIVQDLHHPYRRKNKKPQTVENKSEKEIIEENIKKLLALSKPTANRTVAEKIVERAVKRKPLLEKLEVKKEESKSILFPEESPRSFEEKYCRS